ncbi:hypothetical protein ACTMQT_28345 [Pseudomonas syringae pv. aptata]|uniref:hypothetical protein n=1 Tax=Pseudomonas syringae TaxID=317 RepID=UPI000E318841|nr:hypothetical protein [Pseudomonas syringae]
MRKSLIDSIGHGTAFKLMEDAVLQAIKENQRLGLTDNTEAAQSIGDVFYQIESGRKIPLIAGVEQLASQTLSKQVPIA